MRRLLAFWLALVPVQPAIAALAPPAAIDARCTSNGCFCPRPGAAKRVARSCHQSSAGFITAACSHDRETAPPAGSPQYLAGHAPAVAAPAPRAALPLIVAGCDAGAVRSIEPPPPRSSAA